MIFSILILDNYTGDFRVHLAPFLSNLFGFESIPLGPIFLLYLVLLSIFCVNSINIYAGISGLETGQSLIIGLSLMLENLFCMLYRDDFKENLYRFIFQEYYLKKIKFQIFKLK